MSDFIKSNLLTEQENLIIRDSLNIARNNDDSVNGKGYVAVIKETRDGKRELIKPDHNHIVLTGRRVVMQAMLHQNYSSAEGGIAQKDWGLWWFGVGSGGALASTPLIPMDTSDLTVGLTSPVVMKPSNYSVSNSLTSNTTEIYSSDGYKKTLHRSSSDNNWFQMNYNESRGECLILCQLLIDFDDCPYENNTPYLLNEFGLYYAPSYDYFPNTTFKTSTGAENPDPTKYALFSRYCRSSLSKDSDSRFLILWYLYI